MWCDAILTPHSLSKKEKNIPMANEKNTLKNSMSTYNLTFYKAQNSFTLVFPKSLYKYRRSDDDLYDICVDEQKNIYFCRQLELCAFCGRQAKTFVLDKAVCRACYLRLKNKEFDDEVTDDAENA